MTYTTCCSFIFTRGHTSVCTLSTLNFTLMFLLTQHCLSPQPTCPASTMGKKSRVKTQKSGSGASAVVSPKEMMNLISELLQSRFTLILYI